MQIWYPRPAGDEVVADLAALIPEHSISREPLAGTQMVIEGRLSAEELDSCPDLRWVVVPYAGVPPSTIELVRERPHLSLHNLHHNAPETAETALALLFAAAKRVVPIDQALRRNDWTPRYAPEQAELLGGKTCVLVGYGAIGRRIAGVLRALGMHVLVVRAHPSGPDEFGVNDLPSVLPRAAVLILAAPGTSATAGLIGLAEIASLPDGAILVNVGRAQTVDEQALYEALKSGKLHSAGLDVWYRYPQQGASGVPSYFRAPDSARDTAPSQFPFGELPNIVMSPHRGGAAAGTETRRVAALADLILAAASGVDAPNRVDLDLGY